VGAKPKVITPPDAIVHYGLQKRIDNGEVEWIKKEFLDTDLTTLGREEVDGVVDAVFVTLGAKSPSGKSTFSGSPHCQHDSQVFIYPSCVVDFEYL
jgi:hypothetical protein